MFLRLIMRRIMSLNALKLPLLFTHLRLGLPQQNQTFS
jgi:hypothetical protein